MGRSGPPFGSKLRARKGRQDASAEDAAAQDAETEQIASGVLNRRLMQLLCVLQGSCFLGFGHYVKFHMHRHLSDRQLDFDVDLAMSAAPELQPSGVYSVNDLSLPMFLAADTNGSLLYFHSHNCAHCKTLTPAYEAAAMELITERNFPLGMVNLDTAPMAAKAHGIRRVPTVMLFKNNKAILEMPPSARTSEKILQFVRTSMEPAVVIFHQRADFEEAIPQMRASLQPKSPPVIVGFNSPGTFEALDFAAEKLRGRTIFIFVATKLEDDPVLKAFFATDEQDVLYNEKPEPKAVRRWVKSFLGKS